MADGKAMQSQHQEHLNSIQQMLGNSTWQKLSGQRTGFPAIKLERYRGRVARAFFVLGNQSIF